MSGEESVDVLAVMDADIARRTTTAESLGGRPACERLNAERIAEMAEARAAVAELIEGRNKALACIEVALEHTRKGYDVMNLLFAAQSALANIGATTP